MKCKKAVAKNDGEKEEKSQMIERQRYVKEEKRYREMERQRNIVDRL